MTDKDQTSGQDDWAPCPAGEIQQMVRRERTRRATKKIGRVTSATAIVAVLVIGVVVGGRHWLNRQTEPPTPEVTDQLIAGISHSDVIKYLPAYVNDTLAREDREIFELVFAHLRKCRSCDAKYKALREAQATQAFDGRTPRDFGGGTPRGIASNTN